VSTLPTFADGVVSGCSEAALRLALNGGGVVTFSTDCSITLSHQIAINQAETTIDANGHSVLIGASNAVPLFDVSTNLTLRGLSLVNGKSSVSGGALYIRPGVVVIANRCIFAGNSAAGTSGAAGANGATNSLATGGNGANGTQGTSALGGAIYNLGALALVTDDGDELPALGLTVGANPGLLHVQADTLASLVVGGNTNVSNRSRGHDHSLAYFSAFIDRTIRRGYV
jgi:hypothetical protein